ncbi:MAG TPA: mandelate racemase/muconate lactonizing enzyme family protein [Bryobacteraceae bacterium]
MERATRFTRRDCLARIAGGLGLACFPALASPPPGRIKITGFDIHKVSLRWRDLLFVEVKTDAGLTGLGEGTLEGREDAVETSLRWLEESYVGKDPSGIEEHWNRSYYRLSRWRNGPPAMTALSALDMALWDIEGKRLGLPVSRLLQGPLQPRMRVYYTHWNASLQDDRTPEHFARWARETRQRGWTAVKWSMPMMGTEKERIVKLSREMEAVRGAVGDTMDLALEASETFTVRTAIEMAQAIAPYKPLWIEEPTLRESARGLGEVAAKSPVAIATGEGLFNRFEFNELLEHKGAAIIQPDVMHAGGITEIRKIANLAETFGVEVAPHQCSGPIAHLASLNAMSVCRNFLVHEWEAADDDLYKEMTDGKYPVQKDGMVTLPEGPGLGIGVNFTEFKKRCPYKPRYLPSSLPV